MGQNSTDRGKPGTKRHLAVDRRGLPLAGNLTGAERPEVASEIRRGLVGRAALW